VENGRIRCPVLSGRGVIVKREIFYGIQQGGRIDPKTGWLIKAGDTKNVTNDVTKNERVTTALLAGRFGKDPRTIKRDMKVLQDLGMVTHVGPSNGPNAIFGNRDLA
jgi:hypothetical protein